MSARSNEERHAEPTVDPAHFLPATLTKWPGFLLAWVADIGGQLYARSLRSIGVKSQHLGILTLLESDGPMVQARIGDRLSIVKPAIVGLLNEMEALGLVARRAHPTDRRAFEVHLLDAGRERLRSAEAISAAVTDDFFAALAPEERQLFHQFLSRLAVSNIGKLAQDHRPEE